MKKITLTIEISEKSFELLKRLETEKIAEFRDSEFDSYQHYKECVDKIDQYHNEESFYKRNFCDLKDFHELIINDLVDDVDGSWHISYKVSDNGKLMLQSNK